HAYVYLIYGLHHMLNVVAAPPGVPHAVLVRAAVPLDGWTARLTGPALLASALRVDRSLDGHDMRETPLWIEDGPAPVRVRKGPRVGIDYAGAWARRHLRFWDPSDGVRR
ncbi:MAG TPA: DNA-3-methyladenine glycosylase, partial [Candidatus Thermoplasmatota archaeon]|nr:DNA-3-methyladenine glycosylase [Candidatus Thermoplasmatota archaeon]